MCMPSAPKSQPLPPPPPPPPAPKPIDFGGTSAASTIRRSGTARSTLSIPLAVGGTAPGAALNTGA